MSGDTGAGSRARDPEPGLRLIAEASQLLDELREALPLLAPEVQLEARVLIGQLEDTITTVSAALAVATGHQEPSGA